MMTDRIDEQVRKTWDQAQPPMSPDWQERATRSVQAAMEKVRPAKASRRWIVPALATGVGILVVAVGLVIATAPARASRAALEKVLEQTVAAAEGANTCHMTHHQVSSGCYSEELWTSDAESLCRNVATVPARPGATVTNMIVGPWRYVYANFTGARNIDTGETTTESKPRASVTWEPTPRSESWSASRVKSWAEIMRRAEEGSSVRFSRQGEREIIEVQGPTAGQLPPMEPELGWQFLLRSELDADTGDLLAFTVYHDNHGWQEFYHEYFEWRVPLPPEARVNPIPKDVLVDRNTWWETRRDQAVVKDETEHWEVTIHSVERDARGVVYVSFSTTCRVEDAREAWNLVQSLDPTFRDVTDDTGRTYESYDDAGRFGLRAMTWGSGWYCVGILNPAEAHPTPGQTPSKLTFTLYPRPKDKTEKEALTFHVPITLRPSSRDLISETVGKVRLGE